MGDPERLRPQQCSIFEIRRRHRAMRCSEHGHSVEGFRWYRADREVCRPQYLDIRRKVYCRDTCRVQTPNPIFSGSSFGGGVGRPRPMPAFTRDGCQASRLTAPTNEDYQQVLLSQTSCFSSRVAAGLVSAGHKWLPSGQRKAASYVGLLAALVNNVQTALPFSL